MGNARYRKFLPTALSVAALFFAPGAVQARADAVAADRYTVCLQPLGEHDARLFEPIGQGIESVYGFQVRQLPPRELPASAWYAPRARYRADRLLDYLRDTVRPASKGCNLVVGFTASDISATNGRHADWGVIGLSYRQQYVSMASTYRMRAGVMRSRVIARAVKVVLHEIGHAIGLPHRNDGARCLMNDANGAIASIDLANGALCDGERKAVEALLGWSLPPAPVLNRNIIRRGGKD